MRSSRRRYCQLRKRHQGVAGDSERINLASCEYVTTRSIDLAYRISYVSQYLYLPQYLLISLRVKSQTTEYTQNIREIKILFTIRFQIYPIERGCILKIHIWRAGEVPDSRRGSFPNPQRWAPFRQRGRGQHHFPLFLFWLESICWKRV